MPKVIRRPSSMMTIPKGIDKPGDRDGEGRMGGDISSRNNANPRPFQDLLEFRPASPHDRRSRAIVSCRSGRKARRGFRLGLETGLLGREFPSHAQAASFVRVRLAGQNHPAPASAMTAPDNHGTN